MYASILFAICIATACLRVRSSPFFLADASPSDDVCAREALLPFFSLRNHSTTSSRSTESVSYHYK